MNIKTQMRRGILVILLAAVSAFPVAALEPGAGWPSAVAQVKMKSVDGRWVSIEEMKGVKGTLVVFSCNHCPWAKMWEQRTAEIGNAALQKGIGVIMINSNDPDSIAEDRFEVMVERAKARGLKFPYVVDATSGVARAFGASHTPEFFLFDARGKLVYTGALDDDAENPSAVKQHYLQDALDALLAGRPVVVPASKSIGCSIKFRGKF